MVTTSASKAPRTDSLRIALQRADPAAFLVSPGLLRCVLRWQREQIGVTGRLPRWQGAVVPSTVVQQLASAAELQLDDFRSLPESIVLLVEPTSRERATLSEDKLLLTLWRRLFRARLAGELARHRNRESPTSRSRQERLARLGPIEFEEIQEILKAERLVFDPNNRDEVYEQFASFYLELYFFAPDRLPDYFPGIDRPDGLVALLQEEVDAKALLARTRLEGAPEPRSEEPIVSEVESPDPSVGIPPRWLLQRAEEAASKGNQVRAAILQLQAARRLPPTQAEGLRASAQNKLATLVNRLQMALDFPLATRTNWHRGLWALLEQASQGVWRREGRLLYDLQMICVEYERPAYSLNLIEWLYRGMRSPVRRPLPDLPQVLKIKHLRQALRRLQSVRLSEQNCELLRQLLEAALHGAMSQLREEFRPRLLQILDEVGLRPTGPAEELSRNKLVEELLDDIAHKGFLHLANLRDAVARNRLKQPDTQHPAELVLGDPLLRANALLASRLDGIYRRGEVYLRWMQTLSALFYSTVLGRTLMLFLILPLVGSLFIWEGTDALAEKSHKLFGTREMDLVNLKHPTLWDVGLLLGTAVFLLAMINVPTLRQAVFRGLWYLWCGVRGVFYDVPAWLLALPVIQAVLRSRPWQLVWNWLLRPMLLALPLGLLLAWLGVPRPVPGTVTAVVAVLLSIVGNTPQGIRFEEMVWFHLMQLGHYLSEHFVLGLLRGILWFFQQVGERLEKLLYEIDERLRFRQDDDPLQVATKAVLGFFWFFISYLVRLVWTLFGEPQVNPIKHFPVVTVSHKLTLPLIYPITQAVYPVLGWSFEATLPVVTVVQMSTPGIFGFLAWELKENWRLYRANQSPTIDPIIIGSHGEQVIHLIRPGFHSGTLPRLFRRLRRGQATAVRRQHDALHHVAEDVHRFVDRELIAVLMASRNWPPVTPVEVGAIQLATNQIRLELLATSLGSEGLWLRFSQRAGLLWVEIIHPGWIHHLPSIARTTLADALAGFYKVAGVDVVSEQLSARFPAESTWRLQGQSLLVEVPGSEPICYNLGSPWELARPCAAGLPSCSADLLYSAQPLRWLDWAERLQAVRNGAIPAAPLMSGLLPSSPHHLQS
jgi:hypothetical protein